MKTKILVVLCTLITLTSTFEACKKDGNFNPASKTKGKGSHRNSSSCCETVTLVCDNILEFQDTAHFREVYECLEEAYETWNNDFEDMMADAGLNEDDYNAAVDSLGFEEEQPLQDFEECLGFLSLRSKLRADEEIWLDNTTLDFNNDPEDDVPTDDEVMLTLLNRFGEVIIGGVYYRYYSDGTILELTDYSCQDIEDLRADTTAEVSGTLRRVTFGGVDTDSCTAWKQKGDENPYASGKLYKYKVKIRNFLINCTVSSSMTSYKLKPNGNWRKWRANLACSVEGDLRNNDCNYFTQFYRDKQKKRKRIVTRFMVWDPHIFRAEQNEIWGEYFINSGSYQILYLDW